MLLVLLYCFLTYCYVGGFFCYFFLFLVLLRIWVTSKNMFLNQEVKSVFVVYVLVSVQIYIPALILLYCQKGNFLISAIGVILAGASLASLYLLPW